MKIPPCVDHDYQLELWSSPMDKRCQLCGHRERLTGSELSWPANQPRPIGQLHGLGRLTGALGSAIGMGWGIDELPAAGPSAS